MLKKSTSILYQLPLLFLLSACGGGGSTGSGPNNNQSVISVDTTFLDYIENNTTSSVKNGNEAAKFLNRSTFGPTKESIDNLLSEQTYANWLIKQFNTPPTYHLPKAKELATKMCADVGSKGQPLIDGWEFAFPRHQVFWEAALHAEDQLRQRVALALSEILVVSDAEGLGLNNWQLGVTSYYDVLIKHAFGNYRQLLKEVTLHPAMGDFLSMSRNQKANEEGTIRPDENYARELLQLFTIGVHELNIDGTVKVDSSNTPIPTYTQETIEEFAKVFTGWSYADIEWNKYSGKASRTIPLIAFEEYHDISKKTLLNNQIASANQTAEEDLDFALDNIFQHPNIAPYISKQLIQRLVTSNPSPEYVSRVAQIFNNNGQGVKGDLKAIVAAILLDDEALAENKPDTFGKLREPILRISHMWRALNMKTTLKTGHYWDSQDTCGQGYYSYYEFYPALPKLKQETGQGPLQANSVFNFFRPDFSPAGSLNDAGLTAPEFQIVNANTLVGTSNLIHKYIKRFSTSETYVPTFGEYSMLELKGITDLADDINQLLNHLNIVLLNGEMTGSLRNILVEHLTKEDVYKEGREGQFEKAKEAILLILSSPEYLIQK